MMQDVGTGLYVQRTTPQQADGVLTLCSPYSREGPALAELALNVTL